MNIDPTTVALIAALSAIGGATVSSIINLINTRMMKSSEERKHHRELIINAAIEHRKQALETNRQAAEGLAPGTVTPVMPLDAYIVHMVALSELLLQNKLTESSLNERLTELENVIGLLDTVRKRIHQKQSEAGSLHP